MGSNLVTSNYSEKYDESKQDQTKKLRSSEEEEITSDADDQWKLHRGGDI